MNNFSETIYALSTPKGTGGLAVIRVSGPEAVSGYTALTGDDTPVPRRAFTRKISFGQKPIDQALILYFMGPNSFTGDDVVEYHLHGGLSVVTSMLHALSAQKNHRMAEPGEFTRRAFENGKLDLTEAEAVGDLIHAETEAQRLQALQQLSGALGTLYKGWTDRLAHILALMEADLDFSDQDLPDDLLLKIRPDIGDLMSDIAEHLSDNRRGERLRNGFQIVVLGAPNAGKSSLVNALAQRDISIVSPFAGTTRDTLEAHLDIGGYPVILIDTAGLRPEQLQQSGPDTIESEGIRRALLRAQNADLKILVFDGTADPDPHTLALMDDASIVVINKSDQRVVFKDSLLNPSTANSPISISAQTGAGLEDLLRQIKFKIDALTGPKDTPTVTRVRHREALQKAMSSLERSQIAGLPELAAEDLRLAIRHLGSITGRVDVEDLLDMIFRDFCIGK